MLEATELLARVVGRPDETAAEVRELETRYRTILHELLGGQKSVNFTIEERPTPEEFKFGWIWPYYRDFRPPIEVQASRQFLGKTVLELTSDPNRHLLVVRFENWGNNPRLLNKRNLPYIYACTSYDGDSWIRRRDWLQFGIDLANFAANHRPRLATVI